MRRKVLINISTLIPHFSPVQLGEVFKTLEISEAEAKTLPDLGEWEGIRTAVEIMYLRRYLFMSQTTFATLIGTSQTVVVGWEVSGATPMRRFRDRINKVKSVHYGFAYKE